MTPESFFLKIIKVYQDARIPHITNKKIIRGRSHSISSIAEDIFAHYLISNDKKIEGVYIDQPILSKQAKKQVYPDITVVRKGVITAFIDLKMDLGWNREGLYDLCNKHWQFLRKARGHEGYLRDEKKEQKVLKIAKNASYSVVIISGRNINKILMQKHMSKIKRYCPDIEVFVLSNESHPNKYGVTPKQLLKELNINKDEFRRLRKIIK